jgi:hypothetical protein
VTIANRSRRSARGDASSAAGVPAARSGASFHHIFGRQIRVAVQRAAAQATKHHVAGRCQEREPVRRAGDSLAHVADAIGEPAGDLVAARQAAGGRDLSPLSLDRRLGATQSTSPGT